MKRRNTSVYLEIAKKLRTTKYAQIAKAARVSRQAVHTALVSSNSLQALEATLAQQNKELDEAFVRKVRSLGLNTTLYQPREIAHLAGRPGYPRAAQALLDAGIQFEPTRPGGSSSELARFALTLPSTVDLTARQIADLGGFQGYKSPGQTLKRHGIAYRELQPGRYERNPDKPA